MALVVVKAVDDRKQRMKMQSWTVECIIIFKVVSCVVRGKR